MQRFEALELALAKSGKGFHRTSPWWLATFARFYTSGRKQLVIRKGRRAGGSSTLCRFAVLEALYGEHHVPAGDVGFVAFVSVSRSEASARLRTISAILDALGVAYSLAGDTIEITGKRVGFKVMTCSVAGVSGWTCIAIVGDEVAKWRNKETGANPAAEVLASLRPTVATQPNARIVLSSSPMTESDAHALAFAAGDTSFQMTARGSSWECNPTITEEETHGLEPDERVWRREYLAEPQSEMLDGFLSDVVGDCIDRGRTGHTAEIREGRITIGLDPAFRQDEFVAVIARSAAGRAGAPFVHVEAVHGWRAPRGKPLSAETMVRTVAGLSKLHNAVRVVGDQHHADSLRALFARHNIAYEGVPWTVASKLTRFNTLRAMMTDGRVRLPEEPATLKQLRSVGVRLLSSGIETIEARGNDDRAYALCLAVTEAVRLAPFTTAEGTTSRTPAVRTWDDAWRREGLHSDAFNMF